MARMVPCVSEFNKTLWTLVCVHSCLFLSAVLLHSPPHSEHITPSWGPWVIQQNFRIRQPAHTHIHTHTDTDAHTDTLSHTHTHRHTLTHSLTHTHTHTQLSLALIPGWGSFNCPTLWSACNLLEVSRFSCFRKTPLYVPHSISVPVLTQVRFQNLVNFLPGAFKGNYG